MKLDQPNQPTPPKQPKKLTEIEALARIEKVLNQLDEGARRKVVAFLSA